MSKTLAVWVAVVLVASSPSKGEYHPKAIPSPEALPLGYGEITIPESFFRGVPAWAQTYTPVYDTEGKVWLWSRLGQDVVFVRPAAWKDLRVFQPQREESVQNYGVNLGLTHAHPGILTTNDPAVGSVVSQDSCPGPDCRPTVPDLAPVQSFALPLALIAVAGGLVILGRRRQV